MRFAAFAHASTSTAGGKPTNVATAYFDDIIMDIGEHNPFITTEKELGQPANHIQKAEKLSVAMRAFLGGLRDNQLRINNYLKCCQMLAAATSAIANARDTCSAAQILLRVANSARKRPRTS